ncbi:MULTISPECIES: FAD-dependent monooxygenase [Actinomadura]|uniref:FAD-dependent monooxygenase n=1 Tax=Actinomadura yumaensis TaxID=111807 RepID=A0ABW2CKK4_9ACTN|nr:FAD-dependent monooxygenase [Actinomadura sp. J1-007]MWK36841.1 2,4-dichlorophenol 6-monooxygenase [Actinomadura sp. J1-007]
MRTIDTDVLVVGAGPTGLAASALLARLGVRALTVSRHATTSPTPRAHITNQRTMEILRDLGIEERVRRAGTPARAAGANVWATGFSGTELARLRAWGTGTARKAEYEAASPCPMFNVPQHVLEPLLLESARENGADVRFGTELVAVEQDGDAVAATVRKRPAGEESLVRARYLIGADGGRSTVADRAGFRFDGDPGVLNHAVNVWLEADLTQYCAHRPALLYWFHEPGDELFTSTWICVRPWSEWVMAIVHPATGGPDGASDGASDGAPGMDEAEALAHARRMIGDPDADVRIKAIGTWSIRHALATEYRRGRIFLAGDAAHRHPPPNGLGSNTGVQDAYNLCWKLAKVLNGQAGPALLDTYEAERLPVGRAVVERVSESLRNIGPLAQAFGLEPGLDAKEGWARLDELAADEERGRKRRALLREAVQLQHYQYNCHGVEYGQRYGGPGAAVVADGGEPPEPVRDPQLYYQPSTFPGSPLPHAWVERDRTPLSTLDLVEHGEFTLITGIGGEAWLDAAAQASAALGVPIATAVVDYRREYHDPCGDWAALREVDESGCVLVRPDRYVAWRSAAPGAGAADAAPGAGPGAPDAETVSADAGARLTEAVARLLGRAQPSDRPSRTRPGGVR